MSFIVLMGPAGCGKSTVGQALATHLGVAFYEGDAFHPARNREIMASGGALTHEDRLPWISAIADAVRESPQPTGVLACSALYAAIRDALVQAMAPIQPNFVLLDVPRDVLAARLSARQGHFVGPEFLDGQMAAMDDCVDAHRVKATQPIDTIVQDITAIVR